MSHVTVICPGARRYNIKVTPNTVLLQVLEQACEKQKLNPALHILKHHNKQLDLSLTLRYSGIPNNGKLELVPTERPRSEDGEVVVAVQTADGTRVQSTFHSSASLWDVLTQHKFDSSPDGMEPSLSYMRQEVCGEKALKSKTLRAIGLLTGRVILRLSHRSISVSVTTDDDHVLSGDVRTHQPEKKKKEKTLLVQSTSDDVTTDVEREGEKEEDSVLRQERDEEEEPRRKPTHTDMVAMDTTEDMPYFPALPFSYFPDHNEMGEPVGILTGGTDEHQGFNDPSHQSPIHLEHLSTVATTLIEDTLQHNYPDLSRPHPLAPPILPPQPKIYDEPCDRECTVYHLDDSLPLTHTEEVSDSFFKHTVNDLHIMHSDLKKQAKTSAAPLMTRAMRAVRDEMKLDKYKKSIVRVYFPDRWVLQGCFRPQESLKMLVMFIKDNLADPQVKFHLYTTPPKKVLKSAKVTFAEAGFLPTAVVYVGVADDKPHPHLSDSALKIASSALHAEVIHTRHRIQTEEPHPDHTSHHHVTNASTSSTQSPHIQSSKRHATGAADGTKKQLPKWFRPGH